VDQSDRDGSPFVVKSLVRADGSSHELVRTEPLRIAGVVGPVKFNVLLTGLAILQTVVVYLDCADVSQSE